MKAKARSPALTGGIASGAAAPALSIRRGTFTVHGHRLSSLYRSDRKAPNPFIVLKILNKFPKNSLYRLSIFGTVKAGEA